MARTDRAIFLAAGAALLCAGCGFTPLYATRDGEAPGLRNVDLVDVDAPEDVALLIERAFERRATASPSQVEYDLALDATEQAERLAVQSDASVTRYNYRLIGDYTLIERASGRRHQGEVESIASFNVVSSQYSTLFAEKAAKEKAASQLVEDIERDILLTLAARAEAQ